MDDEGDGDAVCDGEGERELDGVCDFDGRAEDDVTREGGADVAATREGTVWPMVGT